VTALKHSLCFHATSIASKHRARLHRGVISLDSVTSHSLSVGMSTGIEMSRSRLIFLTTCTHLWSEPVAFSSSSRSGGGGDDDGDEETGVFWPGEEEEEEGVEGSRRAEHSVPAEDKGESCQRPHSSELTLSLSLSLSHTHTHAHGRTVIIYLPSTLLLSLFFNVFSSSPPFPFHSSHLLYASDLACMFPLVPPPCGRPVRMGRAWPILDADRC